VLLVGAYGCLFYCITDSGTLLPRFFKLTGLRWFGNMSYSYYLIHGIGLHLFRLALEGLSVPTRLSAPWYLLLLILGFAVSAVVGAFLFLFIEKPFSFKRAAPARQVTADAAGVGTF
jgi:peptidoglycan/LPS O-acetylase OafA/YrhL